MINMNSKAQSAIEFLILIGALMFFLAAILLVFQSQITSKNDEALNSRVVEIAEDAQKEVALASSASDGYRRSFSLPQKALSREYNISVISNSIYVRTVDGLHAISVPVSNVTGNFQIGQNTITKQNNTVYLNV